MRLAALILALAAPAHAAQVSPLDAIADDLEANGLHWVDGVGFRPVDGWEHVAPKERCVAGIAWKNTATDAVERHYTCPDVLKWMGSAWAYGQRPEPALPGAWRPISSRPVMASYGPFYAVPWYGGGGGGDSCNCTYPPPEVPRTPRKPEPSPVPLPATVWLLLAAIATPRVTRLGLARCFSSAVPARNERIDDE